MGDPTKQYLFRISPDQTNGSSVGQQHYWLGLGNVGSMIYDIRYLPINSLVPETTFGDMFSSNAINGGIHLTDVASVPEPMSLALLVTTAGAMLLRRKR
ncbi:MAG: PEP-CTERM sorting domain-containing protein [Phycisphaerales bacterium]|nr:PEP-CTERM sorting domain-containing protein [Phycisphaerales bacterium]